MERTLVSSSPLGEGGRGGKTDCLGPTRPMSSAGHDFRKFDNVSSVHHSPTTRPLRRVTRALASLRLVIFPWDFGHSES